MKTGSSFRLTKTHWTETWKISNSLSLKSLLYKKVTLQIENSKKKQKNNNV